MINVLALDPTSLTLNVEGGFLSAGGNAGVLTDVFNESYVGDSQALRKTLQEIDDPFARARAAHFATCVWHEKRHFLDFLLTNYGALRMRQYFSIYGNQQFLLSGARQHGKILWAPLTVYLDEVHCILKNIPAAWPKALAEMVLASSRLFASDQESFQLKSGEFAQFGGEAQFEALAWTYQIAANPLLLGPELAFEAQKDIVRFGEEQLRYRWMEYISDSLGLLPSFATKEIYYFDYSFVLPLLYASLQVRAFGQTKNTPLSARSSTPSARLFELVNRLSDLKLNFGELQVSEAWDLLNKLCHSIWGRSAMEEIREDYEREEQFLKGFEDSEIAPDLAGNAFADYHRLRGTLINTLDSSPDLILDTSKFVTELLPRLRPMPITMSAWGVQGEVPDDLNLIHGFYEPGMDRSAGWWWAAGPKSWPPASPDAIALRARADWLGIASNMAPLAKLMLNGRAHRTMIGPELLSFEKRLSAHGIDLCVDPQFAFPREDPKDQMAVYYILSGNRAIRCDLCNEELKKPEGRFLQPWLFRHNTGVAEMAIIGLTPEGAGEEDGQRRFWKDWSAWVCCDACFNKFSAYPAFRDACEATFA